MIYPWKMSFKLSLTFKICVVLNYSLKIKTQREIEMDTLLFCDVNYHEARFIKDTFLPGSEPKRKES